MFKAHRLCVSLNSRLASNKQEEEEYGHQEFPSVKALQAAAEPEGNDLKEFQDFNLKPGSSQGHKLAMTVLIVPYTGSFLSRKEFARQRFPASLLQKSLR